MAHFVWPVVIGIKEFMKKFSASCPGKIILSGEHAVVYGCPAVAVAINRSMTTTVSHRTLSSVLVNLPSLSYTKSASFEKLQKLKKRLKSSRHKFLAGEYSIGDVVKKPFELAEYAVINAMESVGSRLSGLDVETKSDLITGSGMGSSAAMAVTITAAVLRYNELEVSEQEFLELVKSAEEMQHGVTTGFDVMTCYKGGVQCLYEGEVHALDIRKLDFPFYLLNTGVPIDSTGTVVEHVRKNFSNSEIWNEFSDVTNKVKILLEKHDDNISMFSSLIDENQKLLEAIHIVPARVKKIIAGLRATGNSAKICGAGSVNGESAGIILVLAEDVMVLEEIANKNQCDFFKLEVDWQGLRYD